MSVPSACERFLMASRSRRPRRLTARFALDRTRVLSARLERRNPLRRDEDQQSDESADQRSVDADVLQILADLQFQPIDQRYGVPVVDDALDIGADLETIEQQKLLGDGQNPAVEPRSARLVLKEPGSDSFEPMLACLRN